MPGEWFLARVGHETIGPITAQQLRQMAVQGEVRPADLVWRPGLAKWVSAGQIKGLLQATAPQSGVTAAPPSEPAGARVLDWRTEEPPPAAAPPAPADENGTSIAFSSKDEGPHDEEPWYYSFLANHARAVLWLGLFACGLTFVGVVVTLILVMLTNLHADRGGLVLLVSMWSFLALILTGFAMLGLRLLVALVLLIVDAARHLRALQRPLDKR
jgi:hypothetical protein